LNQLGQARHHAFERLTGDPSRLTDVRGRLDEMIARVADVHLARKPVRNLNELDVLWELDSRWRRGGGLLMQPDALADHRRKLPVRGQPAARDRVIETKYAALFFRDRAAAALHRPHHAIVALGKADVERDFADIVKQPAEKQLLGLE